MKLKGTFVLLCVFLSFITINAADNKKEHEQTIDDIVGKEADKDGKSGTIPADDQLNIGRDIVQPEYNDKKEYLLVASKDIPVEHIKAENVEETENNDKTFEDKKDIRNSLNPEIIIDPNDVNKMKQPDMQRLARQLSQFRGRQVFHMNVALHNALDKSQQEQEDDDPVAEERAVRRRKRVRRRNTKNRVNRFHNNGHSANRRNTNRPKVPKRNSMRRINNSYYGAKRTKKRNKKNQIYNKGARRGNRNKANQAGKRRLNKKYGQRSSNQRASARRRKNRKTINNKKNKNINNEYKGNISQKDDKEQIAENLRPGFVINAD